jgi:hypothetical protein
MPTEEEQQGRRVSFEHPVPAHMMAIDGTWRRACMLKDVSDAGAKLQVETSIEGLTLNEFFLLLSSTGLAYRRCQLVRVAVRSADDQLRPARSAAKRPSTEMGVVFNLTREDQPSFSTVQKLPALAGLTPDVYQFLGCLCFALSYCEQDKTSTWEAFDHAREAVVWSK